MYGVDYKLVEIRKKFKIYYDKYLKHKYVEIESIRQKYLHRFMFLLFLFMVCCFFLIFLCISERKEQWVYFLQMSIIGCLFYISKVCCNLMDEYKKATKSLVWDKIIEFWPVFKKDGFTDSDFSSEVINNSCLFGDFFKTEQGDNFCGFYKNVRIAVAERKLISEIDFVDVPSHVWDFLKNPFRGLVNILRKKEKTQYDSVLFSGLLIKLKTCKEVAYKAVVLERELCSSLKNNKANFILLILSFLSFFMSSLFFCEVNKINSDNLGLLGPFFIFFKWGLFLVAMGCFYYFCCYLIGWWKASATYHDMMEEVNLEDAVFSKNWNVQADDQIEARYVLTPALMERMLAVKKLFHGKKIDFSFWEDNLLIAVHTDKDMFETTSLFKSALDYRKVQEVICQLYSIFSVIDALKLQGESKKDTKKES